MPPTKTSTGRGGLFDLFPEHAQSLHGGARFDEGFGLQDKTAPKGASFDGFGTPNAADSSHGELWDEWREWTAMPDLHGGFLYDEGFGEHRANESERGALFDLFQPGTQVKFIFDGKDSEGIVQGTTPDGVTVKPRKGGDAVEVGLSQFLAYRSPSIDNAGTRAQPSQAEAPSACDSTAHGARRKAPSGIGAPVARVEPGGGNHGRSSVSADWSTVDHLKSILDGNDVQKGAGVMGCPRCGSESTKVAGGVHSCGSCEHAWSVTGNRITPLKMENPDWSEERAKRVAASIGDKKYGAHSMAEKAAEARKTHMPSDGLRSWSKWGQIAKEVTVAEVAIQAEEGGATLAGAKGAGSYCPECRESKSKLTDDGRCPDCNTVLEAHDGGTVSREKGDGNGSSESSAGKGVAEKTFSTVEDLRKAFGASGDPDVGGQTVTLTGREEPSTTIDKGQAKSDPSGPEVPEREHKESDHHGDLKGQPTTCPHCGQPMAELDAKTDQGAPSNAAPGGAAHKCVEGFLDALRAAA
jgi:ssDNA-binding Zn-finger/Zn-ribbon topoisomerase 1